MAFELNAIGESELPADLFARRPMVAIAEHHTFKRHADASERFEQNVHAFTAHDLAGIDDEVPVAERAAESGIAVGRYRHAQFNLLRRKAIPHQFSPHVAGIDDEPMELPIELDLIFLR